MRRMRARIAGFTMLELMAAIALIGVFASVLLDRLLYYQEVAEKAAMEYTVNLLKLGLQIRIGDLMAQNQVVDFVAVAHENPVTWLDAPLPDYRGEVVAARNQRMPAHSWYYDRTQRELVYVPALNRYLQTYAQERSRVHVVRPQGSAAQDNLV